MKLNGAYFLSKIVQAIFLHWEQEKKVFIFVFSNENSTNFNDMYIYRANVGISVGIQMWLNRIKNNGTDEVIRIF